MSDELDRKPQLVRGMNLTGAVLMSAGLVIGVGLFTISTNAVGFMGPVLIYGNLAALIVALLTSLVYAELCAAWPYSGGSYAFAFESWGKYGPFAGFVTATAILGVWLTIGIEGLAFANYFLSTLDFMNWWTVIGPTGEVPYATAAIIGALLVLLFTFLNSIGVKEVSKTQKVLMFTMMGFMGVSIVWAAITFIDFTRYSPFVPAWIDSGTLIMATTMIWWAYAGQEVIGAMGEEIEHPTVNIPRALILTPFVVFLITTTMQWVVVGLIPDVSILQAADAPFALALQTAGVGVIIFMFFMLAQFMGNFSTINPCLTGASRTWFAMGRDGYLPRIFGRLSQRHNTPVFAIWFHGIIAMILLVTKGLFFLAMLSAFWFLFLYAFMGFTLIAARITRPEKERPFKTPLYPLTPILVILFTTWMMTSLPLDVILWGIGWLALAAIFYLVWNVWTTWGADAKREVNFFRGEATMPPAPTAEEKEQLDKDWKSFIYKVAVIGGLCIIFYFASYFIGLS